MRLLAAPPPAPQCGGGASAAWPLSTRKSIWTRKRADRTLTGCAYRQRLLPRNAGRGFGIQTNRQETRPKLP